MTNVSKLILSWVAIALISSIATFAWNHQTLAEMVEEQNRQAIIDCLSEARTKETSQAVLQATANCNQNLFTTVSSPLISTGSTGTVNTAPVSSDPLWFQIIPQASAKEQTNVLVQKIKPVVSVKDSIDTIRTPLQIFEQVKHLGYRKEPTVSLIQSCKEWSIDPRHCIVVGLTLLYNEAGNMQNSKACTTRNNCFGIRSGKTVYSSLEKATDIWVDKYNIYWYKAKSAKSFYPDLGKKSETGYCYSEEQHHPNIWCPDGQKIATAKWNQLKEIIY